MKVAIGGYYHESHNFSSEVTGLEIFKQNVYLEGKEMIEGLRGSIRFLGGYIDYAEKNDWEIVPMVFTNALPSGPITKDAYEHIKSITLDALKKEKVDAVLLHLHGASVVEGYEDSEGDFLCEIRKVVGDDIPIMATLDLHANVSNMMVENATCLFGFNTQPHIDQYEREEEAAQLVKKIYEDNIKPVSVRMQPPIIFPATLTDTGFGSMKKYMDRAYDWEAKEGVINVTVLAGFYGSDKKEIGPSVVVTTDNDIPKAESIAKDMAEYIWKEKDGLFMDLVSVEDAVREVKGQEGLYAFVDEADDPLGGGPATGTYILKKLLELGVTNVGVSTIRDPEVVKLAFEAGIGHRITGKLGGWMDDKHGEPIALDAEVLLLTDTQFPFAYWDEGFLIYPGRTAVIKQKGITIIVTELKMPTENINFFSYLGMHVEEFNIVILKGMEQSYRGVFKEQVKKYFNIDSEGITSHKIEKVGEYKNIRRPIYPLDQNVKFRYE